MSSKGQAGVLRPADEGQRMERMLCEACAAVFYSAAARRLVNPGARCPRCGGVLLFEPPEPVAAGAGGASTPARQGRRFTERSGS